MGGAEDFIFGYTFVTSVALYGCDQMLNLVFKLSQWKWTHRDVHPHFAYVAKQWHPLAATV